MIVYRGSPALFEDFCFDQIGTNGTQEGKGIYFTDNKRIAKAYGENGYLYTVEFRSKKQLNHESKTITKAAFKKYLAALDKETEYLSNWGDTATSGFENVLNLAVDAEYEASDNDVDLIGGICNASGSTETSLAVLYQTLGYDGIVMEAEWGKQTLYIALTKEILTILNTEATEPK